MNRSVGKLLSSRFLSFLRWWGRELAACVPQRLPAGLGMRRPTVWVAVDEGHISLRRERTNAIVELGYQDSAPEEATSEVSRALRKWGADRGSVGLLLRPDEVLQPTIRLPPATQENLREVLAFEMDRHTPFRADEVYFDYRIRPTGADKTGQISVELAVARKSVVDHALKLASSLGLTIDRVAVADQEAAEGMAFDLLPRTVVAGKGAGLRRLLIAEGVLACLLAAIALYLPIKDKQDALAAADARLATLRIEGETVAALKTRATEMSERISSITQQRLTRPLAVSILAEVTRILPDNTWLTALSWKDGDLSLGGFSHQSASLIEQLEASPLFSDVRFAAPVTSDRGQSVERFAIALRTGDASQ